MTSFAIIDDDASCRRMLESIIVQAQLGKVTISAEGSLTSIRQIIQTQPELILIDLLMPQVDGLIMIETLQTAGYTGRFIMISQNENKDLVAEAYERGVEFFIHKPIHRVEVESVLKRVQNQLDAPVPISPLSCSIANINPSAEFNSGLAIRVATKRTLADLGIANEAGSADFIKAISYLTAKGMETFSLRALYLKMASAHFPAEREAKAIEQRMRRAVAKALSNIASMGLSDYANPKFEYYAPLFFDFREVRQRMTEIEDHADHSIVRIHIKKFLLALYDEVTDVQKGA